MNPLLDPGSRQHAWLRSCSLLAKAVVQRFRDGRCAQVAGSLAFTSLLSLVPFVTLVVVVFSRLPQSQRFAEVLRGFLLDNLLPDKAGKVIATYALQFSQKATNLTIVGGVVLTLTALMLMRTIDQVINQIWRIPGGRPWATRLAAYWVVLSLGPVFLAGGVLAASMMLTASMDLMNEPAWLEVAGLRLISIMLLAGLFGALYFAVPHCTVRLRDAALAGMLAALGFFVMQRLFGLYLVHFPSYTLVYGAFAVVPIFLLWLYLSWLIVLLGAVVAAVLPEQGLRRRPLPEFPGRRLYVAMLLARELAVAQADGACRSVECLADVARVGHEEVRDILGVLASEGFVARRDTGGWLLARAAEVLPLAELVRLFSMGPLPLPPACSPGEERVARMWGQLQRSFDETSLQPLSRLRES